MAKLEVHAQVPIAVDNKYSVSICCSGALGSLDFLQSIVLSKQILIVTNHTIAPLYLSLLQNAFASRQCDIVLLPDGEEYKNQDSLVLIYDVLLAKKHHRDTTIVALGGGVIGDIAGFAASTYQRGVPFIQIPTTLLAQVDASVGGKTAINHATGKNMIGSFYQPQAVIIDINTLTTLPIREFRAGLAEIIKYAFLEGGVFFKHLHHLLQNELTPLSAELPKLIATCCEIKARFVIDDEKEQGMRALLNLGHTFAHALETATHYTRWLHGEAVAIGLYCAAILSCQLGFMDNSWLNVLIKMLEGAGLSYHVPLDCDLQQLLDLMRLDKKVKNGCLRFVLIHQPGVCSLEQNIKEEHVLNALLAAQRTSVSAID